MKKYKYTIVYLYGNKGKTANFDSLEKALFFASYQVKDFHLWINDFSILDCRYYGIDDCYLHTFTGKLERFIRLIPYTLKY